MEAQELKDLYSHGLRSEQWEDREKAFHALVDLIFEMKSHHSRAEHTFIDIPEPPDITLTREELEKINIDRGGHNR